MSVVILYLMSLISIYSIPVFILTIYIYVIVTQMSKGNIDYPGADLHHFYKANFNCEIPSSDYDVGYGYLTNVLNFFTDCEAYYAFVFETLIVLALITLLYINIVSTFNVTNVRKKLFASVVISLILLEYYITGTRQYLGLVLLLLCIVSASTKAKTKFITIILGIAAAAFHATALLAAISLIIISFSHNIIIKRPLLVTLVTVGILLLFIYSFSTELAVSGFYLSKLNSYTSIGIKNLQSLNMTNYARVLILSLFSLFVIYKTKNDANKVFSIVSIQLLAWIVFCMLFYINDIIGYLATTRLLAIPTDVFLVLNSFHRRKDISLISFLIFNVLAIKGIGDYIDYGDSYISKSEIVIFSFWGLPSW